MTPIDVAGFSAGRQYITDELDALRLFAGANSMAIGETLLTIAKSSSVAERTGAASASSDGHWRRRWRVPPWGLPAPAACFAHVACHA